MDTIGKRLQGALENKDMTQRALAKAVGVTEVTISRYIRDLREPKGEIISRIASVLGVSTDYLLGTVKNPSTPEPMVMESNENYGLDLVGLPPEGITQVKDFVEYIKQKYNIVQDKK